MTGPDFQSFFNIGELSKPATVLIEKISDAIGGIFKPYQIVRVAKAEEEAERIRAESQIQISDLQRRALHRFLEEEAKKQKNIEEITRQTLPQLNNNSNPEQIENDWIINFFDRCRLISDSQMQSLWSRVLAGEANFPGTYSKRTVNLLSSMDKTDAQKFTDICTFAWIISGDIYLLIYDFDDEIYKKKGIDFPLLSHLDSIGLIHLSSFVNYNITDLPKTVSVSYYKTPIILEFPAETENVLDIGHAVFTKVGLELYQICGSQPDAEFREYVMTDWKKQGYIKEDLN
jgi:hypothetical protein